MELKKKKKKELREYNEWRIQGEWICLLDKLLKIFLYTQGVQGLRDKGVFWAREYLALSLSRRPKTQRIFYHK